MFLLGLNLDLKTRNFELNKKLWEGENMRLIHSYYKFLLYDIVVILITAFCSILILSNNLVVLGTSKYFLFQCLAPIYPGLLFLVLDVAYIINKVDMKEACLGRNRIVRESLMIKKIKIQSSIVNLLYIASIIVILLFIVIMFGVRTDKFPNLKIEVVMSYYSLAILAVGHIIFLKTNWKL